MHLQGRHEGLAVGYLAPNWVGTAEEPLKVKPKSKRSSGNDVRSRYLLDTTIWYMRPCPSEGLWCLSRCLGTYMPIRYMRYIHQVQTVVSHGFIVTGWSSAIESWPKIGAEEVR